MPAFVGMTEQIFWQCSLQPNGFLPECRQKKRGAGHLSDVIETNCIRELEGVTAR
jgi:hypothetical protein